MSEKKVDIFKKTFILEDLFNDRSSMQLGRIPAFSAIVEEAHNFVRNFLQNQNQDQ